MRELQGKTAIITGAASGLGRAFAVELAREGVGSQALIDIDPEGLAGTAGILAGLGCRTALLECDVADIEAVRAAVEAAFEELGSIDLLINSAGVGIMAAVEDLEPGDWDRVLDIDLRGTINMVEAVYPRMISRRAGHIVNVSSSSGLFMPVLYLSPYAAAKYAVVGFSEALMLEAAVYGVGVTCLCPGNVKTGLHSRTPIKGFSDGARELVDRSLVIAERPESTARSLVKAIKKGRFLVVTTPFARSTYFLRRHFPALYFTCMRRFAKEYAKVFDGYRARV